MSPVRLKSVSGKDDRCICEVTDLFFRADAHITPPVCKKIRPERSCSGPQKIDADTSALFEMKKGAAFSVRQDQQNDAQIFVILF